MRSLLNSLKKYIIKPNIGQTANQRRGTKINNKISILNQSQIPTSMGKHRPKEAYVVFNGRKPGVYLSWDACQAQVNGYPSAVFKGYESKADAQRTWDEWPAFLTSNNAASENNNRIRKRSRSENSHRQLAMSGSKEKIRRLEIPDSEGEEDLSDSADEALPETKTRCPNLKTEKPEDRQIIDLTQSPPPRKHGVLEPIDLTMSPPAAGMKVESGLFSGGMALVGKMMENFGYQEGAPKQEIPKQEAPKQGPLLKVEPEIQLTEAQQAVVTMAENGDNIFLTGAAGSGKTATLKEILRVLGTKYKTKSRKFPTVQVTAPTGIAALPLNGKTTWSFAGWIPDSFHKPLVDFLLQRKKDTKRTFGDVRVLIIDEISMVENHFLERLNLYMQSILESNLPFGGKQVIFVGDFHQLPPVKPFQNCLECGEPMEDRKGFSGPICTTRHCSFFSKDDLPNLRWGEKWAFHASVWKKLNLKHIKLEQIHRQKDTRFQTTLNKIRNGVELSDPEWNALEAEKSFPQGVVPVRLMSLVYRVRDFNNAQLAALRTSERSWKAQDVCRKERMTDFDLANRAAVDKQIQFWLQTLEHHRFQETITLKVGAKVLLLYNLAPEIGLVNGSQGEVVGFANASTWKIKAPEGENKKWRDERVQEFHAENPWRPIVRFTNGHTKAIEPIAVESIRGRSEDRYVLCRTQVPLALGWALSIHKSQGMTLEYVELSSRDIFESGQLYVGLSRATKLEGLHVTGFERKQMNMDPDVLEFYENAEWVDLGPSNGKN